MKKLLIIGSNSVHCKRFIGGVLASGEYQLSIITNQVMAEFAGLPQVSLDFSLKNWHAARQIQRELVAFQPDVVHIHQANSYAWHSLRALRRLTTPRPRVILTTWGSDVLRLPQQNRLLKWMVQYNLRHADVITADSLEMSARINQLLGEVKRPVYTLNFGMLNFPPLVELAHKAPFILSNRLHKPLYRIDLIIRAFAELCQASSLPAEYRLVVAASGEETPNLIALAQSLQVADRVDFTGMLSAEALADYYRRSRIFVSVPTSDGTASSLLEAMAYGCIPVLANLPANLEWVLNQVNGFISPTIQQLSQQILAAVELSQDFTAYQELYEFNYALIERKARFSRNIRQFMELYR